MVHGILFINRIRLVWLKEGYGVDMHREEVQPGWAKGKKVFVVPVVNVEVDPHG